MLESGTRRSTPGVGIGRPAMPKTVNGGHIMRLKPSDAWIQNEQPRPISDVCSVTACDELADKVLASTDGDDIMAVCWSCADKATLDWFGEPAWEVL